MSYTAPTLRSTGDLITASIWNTDLVNDIIAIFGGAIGLASQAANDLFYASSATQLARLAIGAVNGMLLQVVAGVPGWSSLLTGFIEAQQSLSIASNVLTVDYRLGNVIAFTLNANVTTMTLQNIPASGQFAAFTFLVSYNGSGSTFAWLTSTVHWASGNAPTLTGTNAKKDVFMVWTTDGGTTWYGAIVGQNF
jgi:hypothetical protein